MVRTRMIPARRHPRWASASSMRAHTRRRDSDIRQRSPQSVADAEVNGLLAVVSAQAVLAPVPCTQRGALTLTSVCRPVAMIMGFQHALAMLGGIVSVPLIVGGPFDANLTNDEKQYLISAGLISSGLLSMIQIYRMPLGESGYFIGTGLVSVLGTSFTFVPIARSAIGFMKNEASDIACTAATAATDCANGRACLNSGFCSNYSGQEVCCACLLPRLPPRPSAALCSSMRVPGDRLAAGSWPCVHARAQRVPCSSRMCVFASVPSRTVPSGAQAYGGFLGTAAICALLEILLSFVPRANLRCVPPTCASVPGPHVCFHHHNPVCTHHVRRAQASRNVVCAAEHCVALTQRVRGNGAGAFARPSSLACACSALVSRSPAPASSTGVAVPSAPTTGAPLATLMLSCRPLARAERSTS